MRPQPSLLKMKPSRPLINSRTFTLKICEHRQRGQLMHCQGQHSLQTASWNSLGKERYPVICKSEGLQGCCTVFCTIYACETWTVYESHTKVLNLPQKAAKDHMAWQSPWHRSPLSNWPAQYLQYTLLKRAQVRWAGHLLRMPDTHLCKRLFYGELAEGKHSQGGQKKHYQDCLKASLKGFDINTKTWETQTCARPARLVRQNQQRRYHLWTFNRIVEAQRTHKIRKSKAASLPPAQGDHLCPV